MSTMGVMCPFSNTYEGKRKYLVINESFVYRENIVLYSICEKIYLMYPTRYDMFVFAIGYNLQHFVTAQLLAQMYVLIKVTKFTTNKSAKVIKV
jgi:hypothetical protein